MVGDKFVNCVECLWHAVLHKVWDTPWNGTKWAECIHMPVDQYADQPISGGMLKYGLVLDQLILGGMLKYGLVLDDTRYVSVCTIETYPVSMDTGWYQSEFDRYRPKACLVWLQWLNWPLVLFWGFKSLSLSHLSLALILTLILTLFHTLVIKVPN